MLFNALKVYNDYVNFLLRRSLQMKVSSNIGIINALIRITIGFTILSWSTAKLVKRPWRDSYLVMAMIGAMKVGEGIVRYCPVTALFEKNGEGNGFKAKDMLNFKDMLNKNGNGNEKHEDHTSHTKKEANFNPEEFTNKEVQAALNGDLGTSPS